MGLLQTLGALDRSYTEIGSPLGCGCDFACLGIEYDPQPPYDAGAPDRAPGRDRQQPACPQPIHSGLTGGVTRCYPRISATCQGRMMILPVCWF